MKRSNLQRALKYGIGIFISVLSLSASLVSSHHALAAQGSPKLGGCFAYAGAIITSKNDGKILTGHRRPFRTGSFVDVETTNDRDNQRWNFVPVSSVVPTNVGGSACGYKIISFRTGKALTDDEHYGAILSDDTGSANQIWNITLTPYSYSHYGFGFTENYRNIYKIVSFRTGTDLDVLGGSSAEGTPAILAYNNDGFGHAQNWYIGPPLLTPGFPGGPINPSFPTGPIAPGFPGGPINPSFPTGPIAPGFPGWSIAPGFPTGSITPGFPGGPITPGFPGGLINSGLGLSVGLHL